MRTAKLTAGVSSSVQDGRNKIPEIYFEPAYDGGLCNLGGEEWPFPVIFDISGMEPLQTIPIVRDHDQNQKIGQTVEVAYDTTGIRAVGRMLNLGIDDAADKVLALWKRGSELQASIHTDLIPQEDCEFVPDGNN